VEHMTAQNFGRLAETLVNKPKWTLADRDAVIIALREAEKRLPVMGDGVCPSCGHEGLGPNFPHRVSPPRL
jgi:hypothetical protein